MHNKRGIAILAGISVALLAVSLGYFAFTPGAWSSLDSGAWGSSLLQTTAAEPGAGSADKGSADAGSDKSKDGDADNTENVDAAKNEDTTAPSTDAEGENASSAATGDGGIAASGTDGDSGASTDGADTPSSQPSAPVPAPAPANTVTVSVSVSSSAVGSPVSASGTYTFDKGATAYDALCALGLSVNASSTSMGVYVSAIGGLAEKEYGSSSGWMYSVNGVAPNYSAGGYKLQDGDSVSWYYVAG